MITVKNVHEQPELSDGARILVDRLWPRGVRTTGTWIDDWRWDLAPSPALRKWFRRDLRKWHAFKRRYRHELEVRGKMSDLRRLAERAKEETLTLLFVAGDEEHNSAVALKELLEELDE